MNQRPTRMAPAPTDDTTIDHDTMADAQRTVIEQRVTHAPPAVRQPARDPIPQAEPEKIEPVSLPATPFAKLAGAIAAVMAEIKPVEKAGFNKFHNYYHARIGDLSTELTPLMGKHGIVIFQNEIDRSMFDNDKVIAVRYQFTIVHSSGEIWPERPVITGMSSCRNTKDGFDDKSFNKAHTAARKYFLLSLFQIPTEDMEDADRGEGSGAPPRPSNQRRAPAPDGSVSPHLIPINDGEPATAWAERFKIEIGKAKTATDVDKWYDANFPIFEKVKKLSAPLYEELIAAMDARTAAINGGGDATFGAAKEPAPAKPASTRKKPPAPTNDGFPGDTALPPPFDVQQWLESLENAFSACEDGMSLVDAQGKHMTPFKPKVSDEDWNTAVAKVKEHLKRIEAIGD